MSRARVADRRKRPPGVRVSREEIQRPKRIRALPLPPSNLLLDVPCRPIIIGVATTVTKVDRPGKDKYGPVHPVLLSHTAAIPPPVSEAPRERVQGKAHLDLIREGELDVLDDKRPERRLREAAGAGALQLRGDVGRPG